jgi:hypothetical protein
VRIPLAMPKPMEHGGARMPALAGAAIAVALAALAYRATTRRRRSSERGPGAGESAITHH